MAIKKGRSTPKLKPAVALVDDTTPHDRAPNAPADILFSEAVDDLYMEAENWLDGEPIATQTQADELTKLIGRLEQTAKDAEAARAAEKKPHWDAGKAVDAKWKPISEKADKAVKVGKRALTPWLQMLAAEQQRKAEAARAEALEAARMLQEQAIAERASSNLADVDVREALESEAKATERHARSLEREKAVAKGEGRSIGLRKLWLVKVEDHRALLTDYLKHRPDVAAALKTWLWEQAKKDVRNGARTIPGCSIWSEEQAV